MLLTPCSFFPTSISNPPPSSALHRPSPCFTSLQTLQLKLVTTLRATLLSLFLFFLPVSTNTALAQYSPDVAWNLLTWDRPDIFETGINTFTKLVNEQSHGNFLIRILKDGPVPPKDYIDAIKFGAFEMGTVCPTLHPSKTPALTVLDLPLLPIGSLQDEQRLHARLFDHPAFRSELEHWNAHYIFSEILPHRQVFGTGSVPETLQDLKGKKIRSPKGFTKDLVFKLGAVPVAIPFYETTSALQRGIIDGTVMFPLVASNEDRPLKNWGISWNIEGLNAGTTNCFLFANQEKYAKLPTLYRRIMQDALPQVYSEMRTKFMDLSKRTLKDIDPITYSEAELATLRDGYASPIWNEWADSISNPYVDGNELLVDVLEAVKLGAGNQ